MYVYTEWDLPAVVKQGNKKLTKTWSEIFHEEMMIFVLECSRVESQMTLKFLF